MRKITHPTILFTITLSAQLAVAFAQPLSRPAVVAGESTSISEGLVLPGWDYFESAWRADPVELAIVAGTWQAPVAGARVDSVRSWQPATADSAGWISHPDLRGGYLYASVESDADRVVILEALGYREVIVNGTPRTGNVYGFKEDWQPWEPPFDYSFVPVRLDAGTNHLIFKGGRAPRMKALLHRTDSPYVLNTRDVTLPDLLVGEDADYAASVALINATESTARGLEITAAVDGAEPVVTEIPSLPPLSVRKVGFRIDVPAPGEPGTHSLRLTIRRHEDGEEMVSASIPLTAKLPSENHRRTFISSIDGSVQYYGVQPAVGGDPDEPKALVLSVHGAAVEAINQSGSYGAKTWANIVAPTNRRPYGFNWEDWGRLDALEVLDIAQSTLDIDPRRVYLTGHSMGGHGTWHLGALYPDRFGAIGPSAGWISFWSYRPRGAMKIRSPMEQMLMRAALPSRTMELAPNYRDLGVYIIHGADDDNVPAAQSRMMVDRLSGFHRDFVYHEEPDAGHWWDKSDALGADCVDWPPLFDFFARHGVPEPDEVRDIDFLTPNPGVTSCHRWACILQQERTLEMSRVQIRFDPGIGRFVGETQNVAALSLSVPESTTDTLSIYLDDQAVHVAPGRARIHLSRSGGTWSRSTEPDPAEKGPHRNGTLKDAFRNRMVMVYGTHGSEAENDWALTKARFDAEQFWYQGNGGIEVIADVEFDPSEYPDRNIILYGNSDTNGAWENLMGASPVRVSGGRMAIGDRVWTNNDVGVLVTRPRPGSSIASVAAIAGTGLAGMRTTNLRPYLSAGFAYPDLVVFDAQRAGDGMLVVGAGFFGNDWSVERGDFVWTNP